MIRISFLLLALSATARAQPQAEEESGPPDFSEATDADRVKDRQWNLTAVSSHICLLRFLKAESLRAIAEEKEASKIAGVVSNALLHKWQTDAYNYDKTLKKDLQLLRSTKSKPLGCETQLVKPVTACLVEREKALDQAGPDGDVEPWSEPCREEKVQAAIRLLDSMLDSKSKAP